MDSNQIEAKVVLLGSQGVGKTSLVFRFIHQTYSPEIRPTIGASFLAKKMTVNDVNLKLQIWDTAGQERFRSMAPIYYRGAHAAILVFDITSQESFDDLNSWVHELRENQTEDFILYIVGNKTDLQSNRVIPKKKAQETAVQMKASYIETSAKDDVGLNELFSDIAKQLVEGNLSYKNQAKVVNPGFQKPSQSPCCSII